MLIGFILVHTEGGGKERKIAEKICKINKVKEVYIVGGVYDIIVKLIVDDEEELKTIVRDHIRKIEGILSTATHKVI